MRVLVTGGTGYIGSHTTVELINKGFDVFIIDNLSNSHAEVIDSIEKITGTRPFFANIDLNNKNEVSAFLQVHSIDAILQAYDLMREVREKHSLKSSCAQEAAIALRDVLFLLITNTYASFDDALKEITKS